MNTCNASRSHGSKTPQTTITVYETPIQVLVDTGSSANILDYNAPVNCVPHRPTPGNGGANVGIRWGLASMLRPRGWEICLLFHPMSAHRAYKVYYYFNHSWERYPTTHFVRYEKWKHENGPFIHRRRNGGARGCLPPPTFQGGEAGGLRPPPTFELT